MGSNSSPTDGILTKFNVHIHVSPIHISFKFHESPIIGYLVMVNFMGFKLIQVL